MRRLPPTVVLVLAGCVAALSVPGLAAESASAAEASCTLGLLDNPDYPDDPRVALFRLRPGEASGEIVLDTGYPLSAIARPADRRALARKRRPVSCAIAREEGQAPLDWEEALTGMLAAGFRGEVLLHQGQTQRGLLAFVEGLPDPRSVAWLSQAASNLPSLVSSLIPPILRSRDPRRAQAAMDILGILVSAHPLAARPAVRDALDSRNGALRPQALRLAGELVAALRNAPGMAEETTAMAGRIRDSLADRDPAVRAAAADALLLSEPDEELRRSLLARAASDERDPAARAAIFSALAEAGGGEEITRLSHAEEPGLRREALRTMSGLPVWPAQEKDPLLRLLQEEGAEPGEVVRRLVSRPRGPEDPPWAEILPRLLPSLKEEEAALVPELLCRLDESQGRTRGLEALLEGAGRDSASLPAAATARALARCGAEKRDASMKILLAMMGDASLPGAAREAAVLASADLGRIGTGDPAVWKVFEEWLAGGDDSHRLLGIEGLVRLGPSDLFRATAPLAREALREPESAASLAAEAGLHALFKIGPGKVIAALRRLGKDLPEAGQLSVWELFHRLQPEKWRYRILARWRSSLAAPGARISPALQDEMQSLAELWPGDILDLIGPAFAASREEERIRILQLLVELSRQIPERILPLLDAPEGSSASVRAATREAYAIALARLIQTDGSTTPEALWSLALDPADAIRRATGRRGLWVLARENPARRMLLIQRARTVRQKAAFPLRVELGRWLGQVADLGPTRIPGRAVAPVPRTARFLPGISAGSGPAPSAPARRGAGSGADRPRGPG